MTRITRRSYAWRRLWAAIFLSGTLICLTGIARGTTLPPAAPGVLTLNEAAGFLRIGPDELERLAAQNKVPGRRIGTRWRFNRTALLAWLNGDWRLISTAVPPTVSGQPPLKHADPISPGANLSLSQPDMMYMTATGTSIAQAEENTEKPPPATNSQEPIGEAPKERTAEEVFLREQKVLLAPGEMAGDFGLFFSRSDNQQLASVGGGVGLATVEQETFTTLVQGRVGVLDETEFFGSTTFRHQDSAAYVGSTKVSESNRTEFGDIRLGVRHTLLKEGVGRPNVIATIDGRIPTGHTSYAVGGGLALVKSVDPAILFANANYRHTFSREFSDITRLEPEDRFDVSMGYALALNDTLTISTAVSGLFSGATSFDNATLRQQDSYSLSFGLTSWLAKGLYIEPSVSFGLSGPGDSVAFGVTVPYTF